MAVIGGGIAGLLAAVRLARSGLRVQVFETTSRFGGRAQTQTSGGYHLNQGPHALYIEGCLSWALRDLGVPVPGGSPDLRSAVAITQGGAQRHALPVHPEAIVRSSLLDDRDRLELASTLSLIAQDLDGHRGSSLRDFTVHLRPSVRAAIEMLARLVTYTNAPEEIDARAAFLQIKLSFSGVSYPDRGWRTIVEGLEHSAASAGAVLRSTSPIRSLTREGAGWIVDGRSTGPVAVDAVILAVPPEQACKLLPLSDCTGRAVRAAQPVECVGLDLAMSHLSDSGCPYALGFDEPTYFAAHSSYSRLAPDEGAVAHLLRYLGPREKPAVGHIRQLEAMMTHLQPGWQQTVVRRQRLFGARIANDFPSAHRSGVRAPVVIGDTPGVFLAGDWVGDEGMLADASASSAEAAALAAIGHVAAHGRGVSQTGEGQ